MCCFSFLFCVVEILNLQSCTCMNLYTSLLGIEKQVPNFISVVFDYVSFKFFGPSHARLEHFMFSIDSRGNFYNIPKIRSCMRADSKPSKWTIEWIFCKTKWNIAHAHQKFWKLWNQTFLFLPLLFTSIMPEGQPHCYSSKPNLNAFPVCHSVWRPQLLKSWICSCRHPAGQFPCRVSTKWTPRWYLCSCNLFLPLPCIHIYLFHLD